MKLDAWQKRLAIFVLEVAADARRIEGDKRMPFGARETGDHEVAADLERNALESMARALESGESLEVG